MGRDGPSPPRPVGSAAPRGGSGAAGATWRERRERGPPASSALIPLNFTPQDIQHTEDFLIKPESRVAQLDTSQWPLLLKVGRVVLDLVARPCSRSFCPLEVEPRTWCSACRNPLTGSPAVSVKFCEFSMHWKDPAVFLVVLIWV